MKKINLSIAILASILYLGCQKETPLGAPTELEPIYTLPQGKSSADNRIVELKQRYGTYFLYDFTVADFRWNLVGKRPATYQATTGDPAFVGQALDLLDQVWLKFYPDAFLKEKMPFKIFLADSVYSGTNKVLTPAHAGTDNIAVGYVNETLPTRNAAFKLTYKNQINSVFMEQLLSKEVLELPTTFFDVSIYNVNVVSTTTDANYFKTRGFVKSISSLATTAAERNKATDVRDFLTEIVKTNNATWNSTMNTFPLIKRKYDILTEFMMTRYGIDLKQIANATY